MLPPPPQPTLFHLNFPGYFPRFIFLDKIYYTSLVCYKEILLVFLLLLQGTIEPACEELTLVKELTILCLPVQEGIIYFFL